MRYTLSLKAKKQSSRLLNVKQPQLILYCLNETNMIAELKVVLYDSGLQICEEQRLKLFGNVWWLNCFNTGGKKCSHFLGEKCR